MPGWGNTSQSQSDYISLAHYQGNGASNGPISKFFGSTVTKVFLRCNIAIDRIAALETQETEKPETVWWQKPVSCVATITSNW